MELDVISPAFLVLAISLSWNRFACIFRAESSAALAATPLTTAATAISLSGFLIAAAGVFIGSTLKRQPAGVTVALSAISLAAYLSFLPAP